MRKMYWGKTYTFQCASEMPEKPVSCGVFHMMACDWCGVISGMKRFRDVNVNASSGVGT